jgi:xanthine dehydrogenase accessory factor
MNPFEKVLELEKLNLPFVIATVIEMTGSVPGKIGFKMIIEPDGKTTGTVGGGALEKEVIDESLRRLSSYESGTKEYLLSDKHLIVEENTKVIPMMCSGKVRVYFEVHRQSSIVYIFGGGHVGQALLYFLSPLQHHTILIDNRKEIIENKNLNASQIIFQEYIEYANSFQPGEKDFVVVLTQGHKFDFEIVKSIFFRKLNPGYIGVIASKNKAKELVENLIKEFNDNIDLTKLHTPIGLKIGGDTAAEIALSIAAEIQSIKFGVS